jgi:plasmid maintenance system killer protein
MLPEKGLKYNLHYKPSSWIKQLALEADTAINMVNPDEQNYLRFLVAKHIQHFQKTKQSNNSKYSLLANQEWKIMNEIKSKLNINNLILARADNGRTIVILHKHEYDSKIMNFIHDNDFTCTIVHPTKGYKKIIKIVTPIIPKNKK